MNAKLYRHVFSKTLGCLVAVSDIARGAGGNAGVCASTLSKTLRFHPLSRALALALALIIGGTAHAQTLPTGGAIVGGQGHIGTSGSTMTVQQNTARLAVNWNSFNIGAGDTVVFKQPSTSSVALNSVVGNNPSQIYGQLKSNGQVFLINPNGVLFGKSAQVSVGGLFASTLPINTSAFMASSGSYAFDGDAGGNGQVINQGNLRAVNGGFVVLAANQVINSGTISATHGTVALAAGNSVTLALDNAGHASVKVDSAALSALIQNQGLIAADGGQILLTARGRDMLQSNVMNLSGLLQANTMGTRNGHIVIDGGKAAQGESGTVALRNLALNALGAKPGEGGGAVTITGAAIDLRGSSINVSGMAGGGSVLIGGGARGTGALAHALTTSMDASSKIDASAINSGNGGSVVLWSDDQTVMNGAILARGGLLGGNGGSVETSSKGLLGVQGGVSASAPRGKGGAWLLDPQDITVASQAVNTSSAGLLTISNTSLSSSLAGGTGVILDASQGTGGSGAINVTAAITSNGSGSLTLLAANGSDVTLGANISLGNGSFTAVGGNAATGGLAGGNVQIEGYALSAANVTLTGGAGVTGVTGVPGGSVNLNGSIAATGTTIIGAGLGGGSGASVGSINVNGDTSLTGGNVSFSTATPIVMNHNLTLNVSGASTITNVISGLGNFTQAGSGTTTLMGSNTYTGATNIQAGQLVLSDAAPGTDTVVNQTLYTKLINVSANATVVVDMGGGNFAFNAGTVLTGAGTLIKKGAGLATFSTYATAGLSTVSTVNMSGTIEIFSGTFSNGGVVDWSGNTAKLELDTTAVFDLRNNNVTVGALTESGPGLGSSGVMQNTYGTNTLFVGAGDAMGAFSGIITKTPTVNAAQPVSGAEQVNLAKIGAGTQILTGQNTYSGTTTISGGTLDVGHGGTSGVLGAGVVTDNASLVFNYSSAIAISAVAFNPAGITGSGNFTAMSGGGLGIDRPINLGGGNGSIVLAAGAAYGGGEAGGGDLTFSGTHITTGASGTVTLFTGSLNTAYFMGFITGANGTTKYKTYNANQSALASAIPGTFNIYYLFKPIETLLSLSKVYDGTTAVNTPANTVSLTGIEGDKTTSIGAVAGGYYGTSHVGNILTATVIPSGTMTYASGAVTWDVAGYSQAPVTSFTNPNIFITKAPVTVTASSPTKFYDGTTLSSDPITNVTGLVAGDAFTGLTQTYNNSHVLGSNLSLVTVDYSKAGFSGPANSLVSDYDITYLTNLGTIAAEPVTVTAATQNKVFDGSVASNTIMNISGLAGTDTLTGLTQAYDSSHVLGPNASQLTVNRSHVGVAGDLSSTLNDYAIHYVTNTGTITAAAVTVTAATQSKIYDGTMVSNGVVGVTPMFNGDTLTGLTQAYDNAHTLGPNGSVLTVNHNGVAVSTTTGDVLTDYAISYVSTAGTISSRKLFIDLNNITKVYDGNNVATAQDGVVEQTTADTGLVAGDSFTGIVGKATYNSAHVVNANTTNFSLANMTVGLTGPSVPADYSMFLAQPVVATITTAPVIVTAATQAKVFDGTTVSTASVTSITGVIAGDSLTGLFQAYESSHVQGTNGSVLKVDDSHVGVSGNNVSALTDYAISYLTTAGTITPAAVVVTATPTTKTYDGTVSSNPSSSNITGLVNGDTLGGLTQSYNSSHVQGSNGSLLTVNYSGVALTSSQADTLNDYSLRYVTTLGTITQRSLTIDMNGITKVYDGTAVATTNGGVAEVATSATGLVAGDLLTSIAGNGSYNSAHVRAANSASFAVGNMAIALSGNDLSDYSVSLVGPLASITAAPVNVTASPQTKAYDDTNVSTLAVTNVTGLVSGDSLTGLSQSYDSELVQGTNGSTLTVNSRNIGVTGARGSDVSDYALSYFNAHGTITAAPVAVTVSSVTFHQNGTPDTTTAVLTGVFPGQQLTIKSDPTTGVLSLAGPHANDYSLVNPFVFSTPFFLKRLGALVDVEQMNQISSPLWLTVTQSPESSKLYAVADTGELPTSGSTTARMSGPATGLHCEDGAIKLPEGVVATPVEQCAGKL